MPMTITPPPEEVSFTDVQEELAPFGQCRSQTTPLGDPLLHSTKWVCFSDFDGTMFLQDTGHILFDTYGCGPERRKVLSGGIRSGRAPFRESQDQMWGSLNVSFETGFELMCTRLLIDPGFLDFYDFCGDNCIPFNVMSSGMEPILRRVMEIYLGKAEASTLPILANGLDVNTDGSMWKPVWRHDSHLGHDKARSIIDYRKGIASTRPSGTTPLIVFLGDGVSDLAAAREADILFARRGLQLERYCIEHKIQYIPFDSFRDIQAAMTSAVENGAVQAPTETVDNATAIHLTPPLSPPLGPLNADLLKGFGIKETPTSCGREVGEANGRLETSELPKLN
ncbi:MAG: hypothetical protein M1814_000752 [Vezdaea aestivalis]|nr:MAG: hypothetical protein M1814_000752 [Vezdaea aestivalis]